MTTVCLDVSDCLHQCYHQQQHHHRRHHHQQQQHHHQHHPHHHPRQHLHHHHHSLWLMTIVCRDVSDCLCTIAIRLLQRHPTLLQYLHNLYFFLFLFFPRHFFTKALLNCHKPLTRYKFACYCFSSSKQYEAVQYVFYSVCVFLSLLVFGNTMCHIVSYCVCVNSLYVFFLCFCNIVQFVL